MSLACGHITPGSVFTWSPPCVFPLLPLIRALVIRFKTLSDNAGGLVLRCLTFLYLQRPPHPRQISSHSQVLGIRIQTHIYITHVYSIPWIFPGDSAVKNLPANAGEAGSVPGVGYDNLVQYSCLGNPTDRGAWQATVHGVAKSQTQLSD